MKKRNAFLAAGLGLLATLATGCSGSSGENGFENVDYIPVKLDQKGNWSFLAPDGTIKYEDEFKNEPSLVYNGYFSVEEGKGYSLYKADGKKPELVKGCEDLKSVGYMNEGLVPLTKADQRITVCDESGKQAFELKPINNHEVVNCSAGFEDGLLRVVTDEGLVGYVDKKGNTAIAPKFNEGNNFSDGLALVEKDDVEMVIDKKGETVFKLKEGQHFTSEEFQNGYAVAIEEDRCLFVDKKGEQTKCPEKVQYVGGYDSDYYTFSDGDGWGVMKRKDNEIVIRPKFQSIQIVGEGEFLCQADDDTYTVRDSKDEVKLKFDDYKGVGWLHQFNYVASEGKTMVLLDKDGKPVKKAEFVDMGMNPCASGIVSTDYFSYESLANSMTAEINDNGYGKLAMGTPASKLLESPSRHTYTNEATFSDLRGQGYGYSYTVKGIFSATIASYNYDYYYSSSYEWNSDSKLSAVMVSADLEKEGNSTKAVKAMVAALEAKGFKTIDSKYTDTNSSCAMESNNLYAYVGFQPSEGGVIVTEKTPQMREAILGLVKNTSASDSTENAMEEVCEEEVCAEEAITEEGDAPIGY